MLSRDLVTNSLQAEFDVEIADFLIRLMLGIKEFDEIFFDFFQCGDLQLIRPGDKSYTQFMEICL